MAACAILEVNLAASFNTGVTFNESLLQIIPLWRRVHSTALAYSESVSVSTHLLLPKPGKLEDGEGRLLIIWHGPTIKRNLQKNRHAEMIQIGRLTKFARLNHN
jgi:hypothetical protein